MELDVLLKWKWIGITQMAAYLKSFVNVLPSVYSKANIDSPIKRNQYFVHRKAAVNAICAMSTNKSSIDKWVKKTWKLSRASCVFSTLYTLSTIQGREWKPLRVFWNTRYYYEKSNFHVPFKLSQCHSNNMQI